MILGFNMATAKASLRSFMDDESGATAIEYALIAGLIAVALIGGLRVVGTSVNNTLTNASTSLTNSI